MSETQVVIGRMPELGVIEKQEGESYVFEEGAVDNRALHSFLRLQLGKRYADREIKHIRAQLEIQGRDKYRAVRVAYDVNRRSMDPRELQFIFQDDRLKAVATLNHLLVPPEEVISIALRVNPELRPEENFTGLVQKLADMPGIDIGFHLDPGNILTRRAIRVGYYMRVISCFNPLAIIGISGFARFFDDYGRGLDMNDKILRVRSKVELEDRIRESIEGSRRNQEGLIHEIYKVMEHPVTDDQADVLMGSFAHAYGFGGSTVHDLWQRYREERDRGTLWGTAQAASWMARYGDYSQTAKAPDRKMATVAAALLNVKEVDPVVEKCREWLSSRGVDLADWR